MTENFVISIYHDTRPSRMKKNGLYPVRLRVFSSILKVAKLYPTLFDLDPNDFRKAWAEKPRGEVYRDLRMKLQALESRAVETARTIKPFSFDAFEKKFYGAAAANDVFGYYNQAIDKYRESGQIGTGDSYRLSRQSLQDFLKQSGARNHEKLAFHEVTPEWLHKYERYMQRNNYSMTTVGIYLRPLRAIFNAALRDKNVDTDFYPFGRQKYTIPSGRNVKKALGQADLKKLFHAVPGTAEQGKARDFWFFSYSCNGANVKDIIGLKRKNVGETSVTFYRAKTANTSKKDLKPISFFLTDFARSVIAKYGSAAGAADDYVFTILNKGMDEQAKHRATKNFVKFINQNLKKLAQKEGITADISTYYARHSFATNAVRNGASMEFVQEALGHTDTKTTIAYFKGFEDDQKRDLMVKLMDFGQE